MARDTSDVNYCSSFFRKQLLCIEISSCGKPLYFVESKICIAQMEQALGNRTPNMAGPCVTHSKDDPLRSVSNLLLAFTIQATAVIAPVVYNRVNMHVEEQAHVSAYLVNKRKYSYSLCFYTGVSNPPIVIILTVRYSSIPYLLPSRPNPLDLIPPNLCQTVSSKP